MSSWVFSPHWARANQICIGNHKTPPLPPFWSLSSFFRFFNTMFLNKVPSYSSTVLRYGGAHRRRWYAQASTLLQETPQGATTTSSAGKAVKHSEGDLVRSSYYNQGKSHSWMENVKQCNWSITITNYSLTLGTKLSAQTRNEWGLQGMTPPAVETLENQKTRALSLLRSKTSSLEKYIFLGQMRSSNTRLFYKLVNDQFEVRASGARGRRHMCLPLLCH